jgi:hypothetical protein
MSALTFDLRALLRGRDAAITHVRAPMVVTPQPLCRRLLHLFDERKLFLHEQVVAHRTVEALDVSVLLRVSRLGVLNSNSLRVRPGLKALADELWTAVASDRLRYAAPFKHLIQNPRPARAQPAFTPRTISITNARKTPCTS